MNLLKRIGDGGSRAMMRFITLILLMICTVAAEPVADHEDQAAEIKALRERIAQLTKENTELRDKLRALGKQASPPERAASSLVPFSWQGIIAKLPREWQPTQQTGWDEFAIDHFNKLAQEKLVGETFEFLGTVQEAYVTRDPDAADDTSWRVYVSLAPEPFKFSGISNTGVIETPQFDCDEVVAKKLKSLKKGAKLKFQARIKTLSVRGAGRGVIDVALEECQLLAD